MIQLDNFNYSIQNNVIFKNVSLQLNKNNLYCLIGENGVGKSTLLKFLIKGCNSGTILYDNVKLKQNEIFYQESERLFLPRITGKEYLDFRCKLVKGNIDSYQKLEKLFHLNLNEYIENFSTGMKRKIEFIPSLFKPYKLYLFDEPFSGLDFESTEIIKQLIHSFKREDSIVILATHDLNYAENHSNIIFQIENKKINHVENAMKLRKKVIESISDKIQDTL